MQLFNFDKKKKDAVNNATPIERYLNHLDNIFQIEPIFWGGGKDENGLPKATVMIYKDIPEKGFITGITYGLSLMDHSEWKFGRPELCISVKSSNESWAQVAAFLANELRGSCPFCYGQTIDFKEQICEESDMDAFLIFAPSTLSKKDYLNIDIGTSYKIQIAGLYPIYSEEIDVYNKMGLEKFWHHPNFDNYAINRSRITAY